MCQNYDSIWQASFLPLLRAEITPTNDTPAMFVRSKSHVVTLVSANEEILEKYFPTPVVRGVCASTQRVT